LAVFAKPGRVRRGRSDHGHIGPATEKCEHGLRSRRVFTQIADTEGHRIITAAGGPKAWPALTAKQREIVESHREQAEPEAASMARFQGEAARSLTRSRL
jgi:hypothetical protein